MLLALFPLRCREIEHQVQIRRQTARRDRDRLPDLIEIEPSSVPLVRHRRQREAIRKDEMAILESRTNHIPNECGARRQNEHQLGLSRHIHLRPGQDNRADRLAYGRAPRLPRRNVREPEGIKPRGQERDLSGLTRPITTFKNDEQRSIPTVGVTHPRRSAVAPSSSCRRTLASRSSFQISRSTRHRGGA